MVFWSDFVVIGFIAYFKHLFFYVSGIFPVALLYLEMGGYLVF